MEQNPEEKTPRRKLEASDFLAAGLVVLVLVGLPLFLWSTCAAGSPLRDETEVFFEGLRGGEIRGVYGGIATSRRAELEYEAFADVAGRVPLRGHEAVQITGTQSMDDEWGCTQGNLVVAGEKWSFELYLVVEQEDWRVHTWALHEPALIVPSPLLDQCHSW